MTPVLLPSKLLILEEEAVVLLELLWEVLVARPVEGLGLERVQELLAHLGGVGLLEASVVIIEAPEVLLGLVGAPALKDVGHLALVGRGVGIHPLQILEGLLPIVPALASLGLPTLLPPQHLLLPFLLVLGVFPMAVELLKAQSRIVGKFVLLTELEILLVNLQDQLLNALAC